MWKHSEFKARIHKDTLMINFSIVIIGHIICCIKLQTSLAHYHHTKNTELGSNEEVQTRQIQRMGHFLKVSFQGSEREKELGVVAHTFNPEFGRERKVDLLVQGKNSYFYVRLHSLQIPKYYLHGSCKFLKF